MSSVFSIDNPDLVIGFLGTGAIAEAMITGLFDVANFKGSVIVTKRNAERSSRLASKYQSLKVAESNQALVDQSHALVFAVLPTQRVGPIAMHPPNEELEQFFNSLGNVVAVEDEPHFDLMSTASSVMATFFEWAATVVSWMESQGFNDEAATRYTSSLYEALTTILVDTSAEELKQLAEESSTEGGLNEQFLKHNRDEGFFDSTRLGLDAIAERIKNY